MPVPNKIYSLNEIGGRKNNEDSIWPSAGEELQNNRLFIVCDGVGGNTHGEIASELACRYISEYFRDNLHKEDQLSESFVNAARTYAMDQFRLYIDQNPTASYMSTTLTLGYVKKDGLFLAWCGDSKIFVIRNGEIVFQSEDHSLVNELVKRGDITPEEAVTHPRRNVITRSLQASEPYSAIQVAEISDIQDDDYLLLCTDGVTENITPAILKEILGSPESEDIVEHFQDYCFGKTRDNYSMQLVQLKLSKVASIKVSEKAPEKVVAKNKLNKAYMAAISIILLIIIGIYFYLGI